MGNAKICKIGRTMAFTKPITTAAIKAATKLLRIIPGTILAVINNAIALPSQVKRKCFIV
jgi:hypothetical protein